MAHLTVLESVDSTNSWVKSYHAGMSHGDAVMARRQEKGRGRMERSWVSSDEGGLYLSILCRPETVSDSLVHLTQLLSVALCQIIEELGGSAGIKWPNDVLIHGRKVAGILSELMLKGNSVSAMVLGIGVNVSLGDATLESIDQPATSLHREVARVPETEELARMIQERFLLRCDGVIKKGFALIADEYRARLLKMGSEVTVHSVDGTIKGKADHVNDQGALVLVKDDGERVNIRMGDVI